MLIANLRGCPSGQPFFQFSIRISPIGFYHIPCNHFHLKKTIQKVKLHYRKVK